MVKEIKFRTDEEIYQDRLKYLIKLSKDVSNLESRYGVNVLGIYGKPMVSMKYETFLCTFNKYEVTKSFDSDGKVYLIELRAFAEGVEFLTHVSSKTVKMIRELQKYFEEEKDD